MWFINETLFRVWKRSRGYHERMNRNGAGAKLRRQGGLRSLTTALAVAMALGPVRSSAAEDWIPRVDIWHGSHVVLKGDGGRYFQAWAGMTLVVKSRSSSHYKGSPQPQLELAFGQHGFLFGRTPEGDTWFQMENHSGAGGDGSRAHALIARRGRSRTPMRRGCPRPSRA